MLLIVILFLILISLFGTSKIKNKIKIKKETATCLIAGVIRQRDRGCARLLVGEKDVAALCGAAHAGRA